MARVFARMQEVSRVERVHGPYDFVIHSRTRTGGSDRAIAGSDRGGHVLAVPSLTRR
jgi:hypothetical protein